MIGIECRVGEGLHTNQEILHLEFVPLVSGVSQIVITDLLNCAMPLWRYETGYRGAPKEGRCECGRGLVRIDEIAGRIIELLPTADGRVVNGQLFATLHWIKGIKQYQVIQRALDAFVIRVVMDGNVDGSALEPVKKTIRDNFGETTRIEVDYVDIIPYTKGGKYKLVVSEVGTSGKDRETN